MPTYDLVSPHQQRVRTRSTAFLLAVVAFATAKLISLGAVNVSHAHDLEGLQMMPDLQLLDVDCGAGQAVHC